MSPARTHNCSKSFFAYSLRKPSWR